VFVLCIPVSQSTFSGSNELVKLLYDKLPTRTSNWSQIAKQLSQGKSVKMKFLKFTLAAIKLILERLASLVFQIHT